MHFDQGRQRQHLPLAVLHVVAAQPVGVVAVGAFHLSDHLVAAAVDGEAVDLAFAQQGGQGAAEVFHGHAHLRGFLAVDLDHHFRFIEGQVDVKEGEFARGLGPLLDPLGHLQQRLVIVWRVDYELEGQAFAGAGQRRQVKAEDLQAGDLAELGLHFRKDFHLGALALVPGLEQEAADAGLHAVETVDLERRVVLGEFLEQGHELIGVGIQVIEVGRLRGGGHQEHDALVLVRCQFLLGKHQQQRDQAQHDGGKGQHHRAGVEGGVQGALVALLQTLENLVEAMGQARGVFLVAQQHRAHHRRQGQGDDAGDHHGTGQGQGKLLEQGAGQSFKKADGRIHRRQGDGHRHHWHGDLTGAFDGGIERGFAFLDMTVDVLHHDDGVVHHQADRQHHGQQGQQVDRVAHQLHKEQHANHRQRDGDHRDQHRAERAEEQEHHDDDDQHRLDQGLYHLVDGGLDKAGGVVGNRHFQVGWQLGGQLWHDLAHFLDHVQRVGAG